VGRVAGCAAVAGVLIAGMAGRVRERVTGRMTGGVSGRLRRGWSVGRLARGVMGVSVGIGWRLGIGRGRL